MLPGHEQPAKPDGNRNLQPTLDRLNEKGCTGHLRADKALNSEAISVLRAVSLQCCFLPVLSAGADHDLNGIREWEDF